MLNQSATKDYSFGSQDSVFRKEKGEFKSQDEQSVLKETFDQRAKSLYLKHFQQTPEQILLYKEKYRVPIFGKISILDALSKLAECIDPTDTELYCTNQLIHCLQVAEGMLSDQINDETLILTALVHDIGKLAEFDGAPPELLNCPNEPVGNGNTLEAGLDETITTWNHDEFGFQRLQQYVPAHVAWLIRYHSLRFDKAEQFMNASDKMYLQTYGNVFRKYDLGTKSMFKVPERKLSDYKYLLEKYFPEKIEI